MLMLSVAENAYGMQPEKWHMDSTISLQDEDLRKMEEKESHLIMGGSPIHPVGDRKQASHRLPHPNSLLSVQIKRGGFVQ